MFNGSIQKFNPGGGEPIATAQPAWVLYDPSGDPPVPPDRVVAQDSTLGALEIELDDQTDAQFGFADGGPAWATRLDGVDGLAPSLDYDIHDLWLLMDNISHTGANFTGMAFGITNSDTTPSVAQGAAFWRQGASQFNAGSLGVSGALPSVGVGTLPPSAVLVCLRFDRNGYVTVLAWVRNSSSVWSHLGNTESWQWSTNLSESHLWAYGLTLAGGTAENTLMAARMRYKIAPKGALALPT